MTDEIKISHKDALCPMSGIGKPPTEWSRCFFPCGFYDVTMGKCSFATIAEHASAAIIMGFEDKRPRYRDLYEGLEKPDEGTEH